MKIFLILIGSLSLALGIIGIFVPLLPTTPFLLLTSYCYLKSSKTLYIKFINNKVFGKYILDYQQGHGMPLKAKVISILLLWCSMLYSIFFIVSKIQIIILLIIIAITVSIFIITRKTKAGLKKAATIKER